MTLPPSVVGAAILAVIFLLLYRRGRASAAAREVHKARNAVLRETSSSGGRGYDDLLFEDDDLDRSDA